MVIERSQYVNSWTQTCLIADIICQICLKQKAGFDIKILKHHIDYQSIVVIRQVEVIVNFDGPRVKEKKE